MNLTKSKIFLWSCIFFIIGIAVASFLPAKFLCYDLWFFGMIVGLIVIIFLKRRERFQTAPYVLFFTFFIFGIWRYSVSLPPNTPDKIWHYNGQNVEFTGVVNREPDLRVDKVKLMVGARYIEINSNLSLPVNGNVLITVPLYPSYNYGDTLKIKCELKAPEQIDDFYYDRYLAMQNIYSTCYNPQITPLSNPPLGKGRELYSKILQLKSQLADAMSAGLLEPENSLLQGMILNNRGELPEELKNAFAQAGITHIIAISGMNIAIICVIIINFFIAIGVSRRAGLCFSALILGAYLVLIGWPASAVRAGIMAFIAMLAIFLGRLNKLTTALVFAGVLMLLINPKMLRDDVGFQLSFLALLSIIYVYPIFKEFAEKIIKSETRFASSILKGAIDIIILTLAAQVLTLPIIVLNFHQVSLIAPLVNVLVLFLLPFIMVSGLIAPVLSLFLPAWAWLWFAPTYFTLKYMVWVADNFVKLPLAYLEVEYVWLGWVILFYAVAGWGIWWYNKR